MLAQTNDIPRSRVDEVLEIVGLSAVADKRPSTFSLGMGQRLGIAGALLGDPSVLLFDEPINRLDPEGIRWVRNLSKGLGKEGRTVFVSSHLMSEMALTADHLVVIGRGRIIAEMPVDDGAPRGGGATSDSAHRTDAPSHGAPGKEPGLPRQHPPPSARRSSQQLGTKVRGHDPLPTA
jgi:ABC-type multidrug transport system ATPase subunit